MGTDDALGALLRAYLETGREGAVEDLVARTRPRLLAAARRIGAPQDAEDAVQAAYLALVRKGEPIDAPVLPWLLRAVIRIAYRRKAIERRQHMLASRLERPGEEPSTAAAAMSAEERGRVRAHLDGLPNRYRDIITLHYLEGLSTPEIAALLDAPDATVRTRLRRGRELLRGPLAPLWTYGLLALPWLVQDAAAATGGLVVKKKAVLAGALLLLAVATGVGVVALARPGATDPAPRAPRATRAERAAATPARHQPTDAPPAPPDSAATGVVLDRDGRPVADAVVRAHAPQWEFPPRSFASLFEGGDRGGPGARTGPDGAFRVELDEGAHALVVEAAGHSPARVPGVRAGAHVAVTLERAPSLEGTVRDLDGNPVAGAEVAWWVLVEGMRIERGGTSDERGAYRIDDLPSPRNWPVEGCRCSVAARAVGFAPVVAEGPMLRLGGDEELRFDLWLTGGSVVEGRVVDVETREPVPHARVSLTGLVAGGTLAYEETRADAGGAFTLRAFPVDGFHAAPGQDLGEERFVGTVHIEADGYAHGTAEVPAVEAGRTIQVEVPCWPAATVRGRVVDGQGRPVEGASVSWGRNLAGRASRLEQVGGGARTDTGGAFGWTDIPALRGELSPLHVNAHRDGWPVVQTMVRVRAGETTTVEDFAFAGPPRPSVVAEILDEAGRPVPDARVGLHPAAGAPTDTRGRARLFAGRVQEHRLAARSAWSGTCLSAPFVPSVDDPPLVRVVLDATHGLEGAVEDVDGMPVPGATVSAWRDGQALAHGRTDHAGRFRLDRLPAGAVDLSAKAGVRDASTTAVPVDTARARLTLPRAPEVRTVGVRGTVRDGATGERVLRFTALLRGNGVLRGERTAPGAFRFDSVPEGAYELLVSADGFAPHRAALEIDASRPPNPLSIELSGGASVSGTIDNRAALRLAGKVLHLQDDEGMHVHTPTITGEGYRIERMRPGRYWVSLSGLPALATVPSALVVTEGATEVVFDIAVVRAGTMRIAGAEGAGRVEVLDAAGRTVWLRLTPSRPVDVHLPPGAYTVNSRPVEIREGTVTEAALE